MVDVFRQRPHRQRRGGWVEGVGVRELGDCGSEEGVEVFRGRGV